MPHNLPRLLNFLLLAAVLLIADSRTAGAGAVNARLLGLTAKPAGAPELGVIITFADRINPNSFRHLPGKSRRDALVKALHDRAKNSQGDLRRFLEGLGGRDIHSLWTINALACRIRPELLEQIAAQPGVEEVRLDDTVTIPPFQPQATATPEWNLAAIGAPALWNLGLTGAGVVVASLDTGIDPNHADLAGKWRGSPGDWFDPYGQHATPYDANGHGTAVMGVMVGGGAGGSAIGMAPGATWIAAKIFNDSGSATYSKIHAAFGWALDPNDDHDTADAPQIINNSWGIDQLNRCWTEFQPDLALLKEAGIAVVFSAGNDGPKLSTSSSPANCSGNLSVGSTNSSGAVSTFSSRGPSACDSSQTFPSLAAPGEHIRSAGLTNGGANPLTYVIMDGTSFSSPHISGLLALLREADGATPVADLEVALEKSADDLGTLGPDNNSGAGLVNGLAAYRRLAGSPHLAVYDPAPPEFDRALPFGRLGTGSSLSRLLTLRNSGGGSLALGTLDTAALNPVFTVSKDTCSNTTLLSDLTCELVVAFAPLAVTDYSSTLTMPSNDIDQNPLAIDLTGSGIDNASPALLQYDPSNRTLAFGSVAPGSAARLVLTISNGGEKLLIISPVLASNLAAPFAIALDECSNRSLAGQESCRIEFSFSPTALQDYLDTLPISTNAGQLSLTLKGLGNHAPAQASPLTPVNGATGLDPATVTLSWQPATDSDGDPVTEKVSLSEANISPGVISGAGIIKSAAIPPLVPAGLLMLAGLFACSMAWRRRPNLASLTLLTAIALAGGACGGGGGGGGDATPPTAPPSTSSTYTAANLKAATTYNWLVISTDSHGATSESPTWQFTTR